MVMCCPLCKGMIHPIGNGESWRCEDCEWSGPYPRFAHGIENLKSKIKEAEKVNQLRAEAEQWVIDHGPSGLASPYPNRSCWNCNPAHEHLKNVDYPIDCLSCGHIYFHGVRLTEE